MDSAVDAFAAEEVALSEAGPLVVEEAAVFVDFHHSLWPANLSGANSSQKIRSSGFYKFFLSVVCGDIFSVCRI